MSRSRRKPYWSMADSTKEWKKSWHGRMRARLRAQLHHDPETMPHNGNPNEYSNVYDSPRDGSQQYVGTDESAEERKRMTRK